MAILNISDEGISVYGDAQLSFLIPQSIKTLLYVTDFLLDPTILAPEENYRIY